MKNAINTWQLWSCSRKGIETLTSLLDREGFGFLGNIPIITITQLFVFKTEQMRWLYFLSNATIMLWIQWIYNTIKPSVMRCDSRFQLQPPFMLGSTLPIDSRSLCDHPRCQWWKLKLKLESMFCTCSCLRKKQTKHITTYGYCNWIKQHKTSNMPQNGKVL